MNLRDLTDLSKFSEESKSFQEIHEEAERLFERYREILGTNGSSTPAAAPANQSQSEASRSEDETGLTDEPSPANSNSGLSGEEVFSASLEALLLSLRPPYVDWDFDTGEAQIGDDAPAIEERNSDTGENNTPTNCEAPADDPLSDGIPTSLSEELPKFEPAAEMRFCSSCRRETELGNEHCHICGCFDNSLGILNAVIAGDLRMVERLLCAKPQIIRTRTSGHKWSLLHMAASGGNSKMVELLLSSGALVDARTTEEKTPLHYAAVKGHLRVATALLEHGADPSFTCQGMTALDLAEEHGHERVADLLRSAGAALKTR